MKCLFFVLSLVAFNAHAKVDCQVENAQLATWASFDPANGLHFYPEQNSVIYLNRNGLPAMTPISDQPCSGYFARCLSEIQIRLHGNKIELSSNGISTVGRSVMIFDQKGQFAVKCTLE